MIASSLLLFPSFLHACPSCFSSDGSNREAYFWTALIMTLLPLTLVGSLIWGLRKHLQEAKNG